MLAALVALLPAAAGAGSAPAQVDVCFVPGEDCGRRIVAAIDAAREQIRIQAYGFSARPIIDAVVRAKARGVDVAVLLDKSDQHGAHVGLSLLQAAGVPVWIDAPRGIAHVKAMVLDSHLVIGGSYNYTASAQERNVEDATITDSRETAALFLSEWQARRAVAHPPSEETSDGRPATGARTRTRAGRPGYRR